MDRQLLLGAKLLRESHGAPDRIDLTGVALLTAGVVAVVWALVRATGAGWTSVEVLGTLLGGAILLGGFLAWENHVTAPMVPLRLFRSRAFAIGNLGHPGRFHGRLPAGTVGLRRVRRPGDPQLLRPHRRRS